MSGIRFPHFIAFFGLLAAAWIVLFPPAVLPAQSAGAVALAVATMVFLATGILPEYLTALVFFLVASLFAVAPGEVIFGGFSSTAFWMVFGGLVISIGVRRTGLAERMAAAIGRRLGNRYAMIIGGCVILGTSLALVMPSTMGRTLILLPIILAMADRLGYGEGSNGRMGMVLAVSFSTMLAGFAVMPATVPAMVLVGASETMYGVVPVYGSWLLLHFPVLGLLKSVAIWALIVWLLPDAQGDEASNAEPAKGPMGRDETIMAVLLALALMMWITDFMHHVSPAWIALAVAIVCLIPFVGVVPGQAFNDKINYASLFYLACILGVGALVSHSGAGDVLARAALAALQLEPGETLKSFAAIVGVSTLSALLVTTPSVPIIMAPLAQSIADAASLPLESVLMMIVVGFSTLVLPYQVPPLVVAMQMGNVPFAVGNKMCLALFAVTVVVLIPLDYLWWLALGRLG